MLPSLSERGGQSFVLLLPCLQKERQSKSLYLPLLETKSFALCHPLLRRGAETLALGFVVKRERGGKRVILCLPLPERMEESGSCSLRNTKRLGLRLPLLESLPLLERGGSLAPCLPILTERREALPSSILCSRKETRALPSVLLFSRKREERALSSASSSKEQERALLLTFFF